MKDYYGILGIPKDSSESEIRKTYRRLAKKYHPDVNKSENAYEKFIEITEAYEMLIDRSRQESEYEGKTRREQYVNFRESEEFELFRKKAREKAQKQAKMRFDEFKKQAEIYQKSGFYDIGIIISFFFRLLLIPLALFLFLLPVYIALENEWTMIFLFIVTWPFSGIIAWYIHDNRKQYFKTGKLYYNLDRIKQIYTETNPTGLKCYYCPSKNADSKPYRLELLKLKEIKLKSEGFRQHNANYNNEYQTVLIPRSRKAFINHSLCSLVKITSIISCLLFLNISSIVWRIILGMFTGGLLSVLYLFLSGTKSNTSYLLSISSITRILTWLVIIGMVSVVSISPFNITTSEYIYFVLTFIIVFDCFLMQFINLVTGSNSLKPLFRQYSQVKHKFDEGYIVYNDVAVISFVYPVFRWISG